MGAQTSLVRVPPKVSGALFQQPSKKAAKFYKVVDSRGDPIRGLWRRNQRFYACLRVPGKPNATKVCLVDENGLPWRTLAEARAALHDLLGKRRNHSLPAQRRTPTLTEWVESYISWLRRAQTKSPLTITKETGALSLWSARLGTVRIADLRRAQVNEFVAWRKETHQVSNRTINLDIIALNNCLRHAQDEGLITTLPTDTWRPLQHRVPRRPLWTIEEIERVCVAAIAGGSDGQLLADYIRFLACSGLRRSEALHVTWDDMEWPKRKLVVRIAKYGRPREVDFNPRLEALLHELHLRAVPGAKWLFPSPRNREVVARNLQGGLERARAAAGLPDFCFHDLRHYFASECVMAGIDYMTIAKWLGHRDGGVLIGRIYGHLNNVHTQKQAAKLTVIYL